MTPSEPETALREAAASGKAQWPGLALPVDAFAAHVGAVGADLHALAQHGADLYFACACARGDQTALEIFDRRLLPSLDRHVARFGIAGPRLDDVRQNLRVRLFADRPPRINLYAGRGPLLGWLRVTFVRVALDMQEAAAHEAHRSDHEAVARLVATDADPALGATRNRFRAAFQEALDFSLGTLSPRAKTVLRMYYVDGLNIDAIGVVYQVHRSTVKRWLATIRSSLLAQLRDRLAPTLRPTSSEFRSLAANLHDELHISVDRVLADS